jgi:23S rRNA (uracil1939-C5)-methyltransferase
MNSAPPPEEWCRHLPACPGCPRFGSDSADSGTLAQLSSLCAAARAPLELEAGPRRRFRHRARLSVRGRQGRPKIGIFAQGSHRVVDIPGCEIHHPLINRVAAALKRAMRETGCTCYGEATHLGLVRGLQVVVERSSQTAQIVLICNSTSPDPARPVLAALSRELGDSVHSLWWNGNAEVHNRILGDHFELLSGRDCVMEQIGGASVFFPPGAFGQNNLDLFERLVAKLHALVPPERVLVELYAGAGAIGLGLVQRSQNVVFNEIGPASLAGLERGIAALPGAEQARVRVVPGSAEIAASEIRSGSVVIVDPPRKGLDAGIVERLGVERPERLFYVSCDLGSLIRDTALLARQGLELKSATAYDLFPHTEHIETLALFAGPEAR